MRQQTSRQQDKPWRGDPVTVTQFMQPSRTSYNTTKHKEEVVFYTERAEVKHLMFAVLYCVVLMMLRRDMPSPETAQ